MTSQSRNNSLRGAPLIILIALVTLVGGFFTAVHAQINPGFNHATTGFILDGRHARLQCEDCHKTGIPSRGLPRDCNGCHIQGGLRASTSQLQNHIPTAPNQSCQDCHTQNSWTPAVMRHTTAMQGQCARCHNSVQAPGKPASHLPTTSSCDACHTTGAWKPVKAMVHDASTVGRCSICHNGTTAMGKSAYHIPTNAQCDTCHTSTVTFLDARYTHDSSAWGRCSTCHNGQTARGRPPTHIPSGTTQCDACHTNHIAFTAVSMNHTGMSGQCSNCHNGTFVSQNAQTKPATHVTTNAQCDSSGCHTSTTTWAGATYAHNDPSKTYPGNCATCHYPGGPGLSKPSPHVPTTRQCDNCHKTFTAFRPAQMDHTATAGQCSTCHNGTYTFANALTKATVHIPTANSCDVCHVNFVAFSPATMDHTGLTGQCSTCHSGAYLTENAQMKPATHAPTSAQCDTCHKSTVSWATAAFSHDASTIGVCSNCHKAGGPGLSKPTNHVPTALQCDTCHANYVAFKPAFMNHTGTTAQCSSCHSGAYVFARADRQGTTHIPETRQCDTCHTSTVIWTTVLMVHPSSAPGNCSSCHSGQYLSENAQTKPPTHTATSAQCDTCHKSLTSWATTSFAHDASTIGVCSNCHKPGGPGLSKPTNHLPTATQCDVCHTNYVAFKPALMNHSGLAGQCSSCHNATYAFANANQQGATHIPTSAQCDGCHTSTLGWAARSMNHNLVSSIGCSTCHSGAYLSENAQTKSASHIPVGTTQCSSCHKNYTAFSPAAMDHNSVVATACATCHGGAYTGANAQTKPATHVATALACNSSGCHASTVTWAGLTYAHQAADQTSCSNCHKGGGPGLSKPATHIPTTAQCGVCHNMPTIGTSTYSTHFKPIKSPMDHVGSGASTSTCSTCHSATYAFANANPQGPTHIPTAGNCVNCHKTGFTSWAVPVANMDHTGQTGKCSTCHSGGYLSENAQTKGTTHIPTSLQCDTCHLSFMAFSPATMDHTGLTGQCSTCHSGTYLTENAQMKPPTHTATTAQCDTCHKSTVTWASATFAHDATTIGVCSNCHKAGGPGLSKPVNHIPTALQCDTCHTNYVAFKPAFMNHTGTTTQCSNCHNGAYVFARADKQGATHIPDTRQCDTCHTSTVVWTLRLMVHPASAPGTCSTCHNGQYISENAQTKSATHVATIAQCDTCHRSMTTWATVTYVHDATAIGVCSNCHKSGGPGLPKPVNHLPTASQCDVCHTNYIAFKPAQTNHTGLAGQCSTCHNATYAFTNANPQGTTHIPVSAQCDGCHTSTVGWAARSMNHALVSSTGCSTCHSGAYLSENAQTKSAAHIPVGTIQCGSCHKNYTAFSPAAMDHTAVVATPCSTCHGGAYLAANAQTKPATHVATALACNSSGCHNNTTTWAGVAYAHQAADQTNCSACHKGGGPGLSKPTPHIPTTAQCGICHNMPPTGTSTYSTRFKPIKSPMDHVASGASTATCSTCHNATYAYANANPQGVTHIPTTANCVTCHKTGFASWTPVPLANMDHTGQTGKCSTCHSGGYLSEKAQSKGTTHIPTTQQCDYCHTGGYLDWTALPRMNHTGLTGQCSTCHSGAYLSENAQMKSGAHIPTTAQCDSCHLSTTVWTTVQHIATGITGQCQNCHNGSYTAVGAQAKIANHILTSLNASWNSCDACHKTSYYTAWANDGLHKAPASQPAGTVSTRCKTCHYDGNPWGIKGPNAVTPHTATKPKTNAISLSCDTSGCHNGTKFTNWKP